MSVSAEPTGRPELPRQWDRLERLAEEAAVAMGVWRRRATEAEEEIGRLRRALEEVASAEHPQPDDLEEELRRVRAENAALRSRLVAARQRVQNILKRLIALGIEP
jgi:chromosome segregation ATPase